MRPVIRTGMHYFPITLEETMRGLLLLVGTLLIFVGAGCAKKESPQSSSTGQAAPTTETTSPPKADEGEQVNTSGSVADILGRMREQEGDLEKIIASGQLNDVHKKAFAVRDLVAAAAGQANDAQKIELKSHIAEVRAIAGELDEAGDSGDLGKVKTAFAKFQSHLRAIESVLGAATR